MKYSNYLRYVILWLPYVIHRNLINRSKFWSAEQVGKYKNGRVYNADARDIKPKSEYQQNLKKYSKYLVPGLVRKVSTGGTTGQPFVFYMDTFWTRQKERAYIHDIWSYAGYKAFDLRVIFRGDSAKREITYDFLENSWNIPANFATSENKEEINTFLEKLDSFFLHVYPSSLFTLIDFLGEKQFRKLSVKGVLAGSEAFPVEQMNSFINKYEVPVAHWYGHSEYAVLARYCKDCNGFHFYPTYGAVQFRKDSGSYKILANSYNEIGTKFIRYDTGDKAVISDQSCQVDSFDTVNSIEGRSQEYFIDNEGLSRAFGPFLFGIHGVFWERISTVQFAQALSGVLSIRLRAEPDVREWCEKYLSDRFSVVDIEFDYEAPIVKTRAGKHRYFIDSKGV